MFGVVRIRSGVESSIYDEGWCIDIDRVIFVFVPRQAIDRVLRVRELCANVSHERLGAWVNVLGIIFVHDLLMYDRGIFRLLRKAILEQQELAG